VCIFIVMKNLVFAAAFVFFSFFCAMAAQDKTNGGVKGVVKNADDKKLSGVTIEARQGSEKIATTQTDDKGNFVLSNLKPGIYRFAFKKDGYSEGISGDVTIKAGSVLTLKNLILFVDKGVLAIVRGAVFDANGYLVPGAKVVVYRIDGDSLRKINEKYAGSDGEFGFRLPAKTARYRIQAVWRNLEGSKDFEFSGGEISQVAVSIKPKN
jgi:5-hydroxyisourate hydrolase-like protein (transthyretin family)